MTVVGRERGSSCTMVLFGASGDLTQRMVMPAVFRLACRGLLPSEFHVIRYARSKATDEAFRSRMRDAVMSGPQRGDDAAWPAFASRLSYVAGEYDGDQATGYAELAHRLEELDGHTVGTGSPRLFYLVTPPVLFASIMTQLSDRRLAGRDYQPGAGGWAQLHSWIS